jgi:hypothetical protein
MGFTSFNPSYGLTIPETFLVRADKVIESP